MNISSELVSKGWFLSNIGLEICKEGLNPPTVPGIINRALNIDLKEIGSSFFPDDISRGKIDYVSGPGVVQIQRIKNATAPKYEYGSGAPPILRLLLTDGNAYVNCLQWGQWKSINMDTPPGTKIFLKPGKIPMQNNFLLLDESQFTILGGCVTAMVEKWDLCRRLESHVRTKGDDSGPPPWIPFGKPINAGKPMKGKNFRSLETENKEAKEDEAFKQQRLANIAEVARVKEGKPKVFGGGKEVKPGNNNTNNKAEGNNFSQVMHSNYNDSSNYHKSQRSYNDYEDKQISRKPSDDRYPRNNRNTRNWSNQDPQQSTVENASQSQSYTKDKRLDQRNKFNSNDTQNSRGQGTYHQRSFNNNSYRGNDGANFSKKFSRGSNFYDNTKPHGDKYYSNANPGDIEDVSQKMSQVKLHGYDSQNHNFVSVPSKPFVKQGAEVMAKYWEDEKYYRAVVHAVGDEGKTCVVFFQEYGNYEEVLINDVQQVQSRWNAGPFTFQPSHWENREKPHESRSLEFQDNSYRSSQSRNDRHKNQRQQDFRPSAKLYQPPQQRQMS